MTTSSSFLVRHGAQLQSQVKLYSLSSSSAASWRKGATTTTAPWATTTGGAAEASSSASYGSMARPELKQEFFKPKLVIFDKDGTLVCFHTMWTPWCTSLAER